MLPIACYPHSAFFLGFHDISSALICLYALGKTNTIWVMCLVLVRAHHHLRQSSSLHLVVYSLVHKHKGVVYPETYHVTMTNAADYPHPLWRQEALNPQTCRSDQCLSSPCNISTFLARKFRGKCLLLEERIMKYCS